jgi:hypothetical protein
VILSTARNSYGCAKTPDFAKADGAGMGKQRLGWHKAPEGLKSVAAEVMRWTTDCNRPSVNRGGFCRFGRQRGDRLRPMKDSV